MTSITIYQDTRKPLDMWFRALWFVANKRTGVSALGWQRLLGRGSYLRPWTWLHQLRRAMIRPERGRLSRQIAVDETSIG